MYTTLYITGRRDMRLRILMANTHVYKYRYAYVELLQTCIIICLARKSLFSLRIFT